MPSTGWSITTYSGVSGLEAIEAPWRSFEMARRFSRAHHGYDAAVAYARHLAPQPDSLRYHVVTFSGVPRAIVPTERRWDHSLFVPLPMRGMPWPWGWPFADVIAADEEAAERAIPLVLDAMRGDGVGGSLLVVGALPSDSAVWRSVTSCGSVSHIRPQGGCDYVETDGSYDEHLARLHKNFRNNLRKARNKLASIHGAEFVTARGEDVSEELERFMLLEASGWKSKDRGGRPLLSNEHLVAYHREWLSALASQGRCEINSLYLDGQLIASQICLITGDVYEIDVIAYDEQHRRLAPGQLLLEHTLRRCFDSPDVRAADLLSDMPWHRDWGIRTTPMSVGLIALSAAGRLLVPVAGIRYGPVRRAARAYAARVSAGGASR